MPGSPGCCVLVAAGALALLPGCGSNADSPASGGASGTAAVGGGSGGTGGAAGAGGIGLAGGGGSLCLPQCSDDLHTVLNCDGTTQPCLDTEGCDAASPKCVNACDAAASKKRSVGCEYYSVFMDQLKPDSCFAVFVANTWATDAQISVEYDGQQLPVENFAYLPGGYGGTLTYAKLGTTPLPPGKVAILFLAGADGTPGEGVAVCPKPSAVPTGAMLFNKSGKGKAFRITTNVPVVAYQMNPYGGGSAAITGASLLIPTSAWNTNYLGMPAYDSGPDLASMNIVAREATTITLLPSKDIVGGGQLTPGTANTSYSFTLAAGEHAQFSQLAELYGTPIQSDKPVGFFAGGRCSEIPFGVYACDHVEQMVPPIQSLGSEYVGVSYKSRGGEPWLWRVVGVVDGTSLTWSSDIGGPPSIARGQVVEFSTMFPFVVTSQDADHPFVLTALMSGGDTNGMTGTGDPDVVLSVPPAQYLKSYVFFADPTYPDTNLVVVRAPTKGQFSDVTLDCVGVLKDWKPVGDYEYTRVDLMTGNFQAVGACSTGAHKIESDSPFGLWVWGWGAPATSVFSAYVSYGYPGGMNLEAINKVVVSVPK